MKLWEKTSVCLIGERDILNPEIFSTVFIEEIDDFRLDNQNLDEVKVNTESLDELDNDNDNDDKRNDRCDAYDKDGDDDDIYVINDNVGNPREIRPMYYYNTDRCPICNDQFIRTPTDILTEVYDIEVLDDGVIYFEECRHMLHIVYVTRFCDSLESIECPCCDSVDSYLDCQSYNEQVNMLSGIFTIEINNVKGNDNDDTATNIVTIGSDGGDYVGDDNKMMLVMIIIMMIIATITMRIIMTIITMMINKIIIIKIHVLYVIINLLRQLLEIYR